LGLIRCKRITGNYNRKLNHLLSADLTLKLIEVGCPSLKLITLGNNKTSDTGTLHSKYTFLHRLAVDLLRTARPDLNVTIHSSLASSMSGTIPVEVTPRTVKSAMRSLMYDLKQIEMHPLPFVSAHPLEGDMFIWHGNLVGPGIYINICYPLIII
jgi:hypothetical protein